MMKRILLVDDEQEICTLLSGLLVRAGMSCRMAHSLAEGRSALKSGHFDAVFLDIHLPDGLGYELIPEIKHHMPQARCVTISAVDAERDRAMAHGADGFVAKPFSRSDIWRSLGVDPTSFSQAKA